MKIIFFNKEYSCDQADDCYDGSDESDCSILKIDSSKYLKDKHPSGGVDVYLDIDITRILLIDEVCIKIYFHSKHFEGSSEMFRFRCRWRVVKTKNIVAGPHLTMTSLTSAKPYLSDPYLT